LDTQIGTSQERASLMQALGVDILGEGHLFFALKQGRKVAGVDVP
jgi:hypothetical protein